MVLPAMGRRPAALATGLALALLVAALVATFAQPAHGAGASAAAPSGTAAGKRMPTAAEIDAYLGANGSPMVGQGSAFVAAGGAWKVDPRLLVAIAGAESSFGRYTCAPFNGWGWGCPNGPYSFTSWSDAIDTIARGLRTGYLAEGRTTVAAIQQKYAPSGAANDPTGLNNHWVQNVSGFLVELGGDPMDVDMDGVAGQLPVGPEVQPAAVEDIEDWAFRAPRGTRRNSDGAAPAVVAVAGAAAPVRLRITLANSGEQAWTPATVRLRRVDIDPGLSGAPWAALTAQRVEPGTRGTFVAELSPSTTTAGTVSTRWMLEGPAGGFGDVIVRAVEVRVAGMVVADPVVSAPTSLVPGQQQRVIVRMRNAGADDWVRDGAAAVGLGVRSATGPALVDGWPAPNLPAVLLERRVAPGETGTFAFSVRPAGLGTAELELLPVRAGAWARGEAVRLRVEVG